MTIITIQLLDALLSPTEHASAEAHYQSLPPSSRTDGLLSLLLILPCTDHQDIGRAMLSCVLLRREIISSVGVVVGSASTSIASSSSGSLEIDRLRNMAGQLMNAFFEKEDGNGSVRRQIGFVVAEICSSLILLDDGVSLEVIRDVLSKIVSGCIALDRLSLNLLSILAQRSPISLWNANDKGQLETLFQSAITTLQKSTTTDLSTIQYLLEALCHVGISSTIAQKHSTLISTAADRNDVLRKTIQIQATTDFHDPNKLSIQTDSPAARLGRMCIPTLLHSIAHRLCGDALATNNNANVVLRNCMEHLSHCASNTPSLLAADLPLLTCVISVLLRVSARSCTAAASPSTSDELVSTTRLSALEVLASLTEVPDVARLLSGEEGSALWQACFVGEASGSGSDGGVVSLCAELIAGGVDEDVEGWEEDGATLQDDATSWENDDTANHTETIFQSLLQNLATGTHFLTVLLPIVEAMIVSNVWQNQRAALSLLEICLTTLPSSFSVHAMVALETALQFTVHPCVRVQFQAIQLLGAICQADTIESDKGSSTDGNSSSSTSRPIIHVRERHGARILQSLTQILASSKCTKVVCHACLAIVSYCRGGNGRATAGGTVRSSLVVPFLGDILNAFAAGPLSLEVTVMQHQVVFIRAFAAIACLADVVGADFVPFYGTVVPGLLDCAVYGLERDAGGNVIAVGSVVHETVVLRGAAIEAVTIIGQAIDNEEVFLPDAEKITTLIMTLLKASSSSDSSIAGVLVPKDQVLAASARIASVMGARYAPFAPHVLPHLLSIAREKADVSVTSGNEAGLEATGRGDIEFDEDTGAESMTVSLPGIGLTKLILNTTQILEKALAARAVYEHANAMGASFGPYGDECIQAFLPLVNFKYSAEVRTTAAQALGPVFDSVCELALSSDAQAHHTSIPVKVFAPIVIAMARQLQEEDADDFETLSALSDAISSVCYSAFCHTSDADGMKVATLTFDQAYSIVQDLITSVGSCLEHRAIIIDSLVCSADGKCVDDDQRIEYEEILAGDAEFLTGLTDSIGYTLKSLKEDFVPIFERWIYPIFGQVLISNARDPKARLAAICLFDDCIEHCGSTAASKYGPILMNGVMQVMNNPNNNDDIELKEASVYGVAQLARHAPKQMLSSLMPPLLQRLMAIAKEGQTKGKDDIEHLRLVENSSSAVATLCLFKGSPFQSVYGFDRKDALDVLLSNLPLLEDEDEAKFCHEGLCELAEDGEIDLSSNVQRLVNIIGQISAAVANGNEIASMKTCKRLAHILGIMQQGNSSLIQQAYSGLSQEAQYGITILMEN